MYLKLNDTKITIFSETHDANLLTLFIEPELEMQEIYNLFTLNSLENLMIFDDHDSLLGVYSGYVTIDTFFFRPVENTYVINLSKYVVTDLQEGMEKCLQKCDELSESVTEIQNGDLTKQSEYALQVVTSTFTDEQAINCIQLFPEWNGDGVSYKKDQRLRYKNMLFKVLQDHVSQNDWVPGNTPSLYVEVSDPAIEYPEWKKPTGAHDAYAKGDKITFKGKKYISKIDSNVYSPEEYPDGWDLVED